ncbi:MAG: hypothetical protein ACI38A_05565 [Candidatus Ornithomonoglobus sp.]
MEKELKIKKEFKNLIRPLHRQEFLKLEENILKDGCRDPIITWRGYIVDGHNRYEICTKHHISFNVLELEFEYIEDVIVWICVKQLGRRNISDETRKFLIGMQYESEKIINARKNQSGRDTYNSEDNDFAAEDVVKAPNTVPASNNKTAKRIAEENHLSCGTVQKYAIYTRALEAIGAKVPELIPKILSGRYKISHNNIIELSKLKQDELKQINKKMNRSNSLFFQYSRTRNVLQAAHSGTAISAASIKDMPVFDPDAEVTELTLTMPSWISSIKRTQSNANLSVVTAKAKEKLTVQLSALKETIENMLSLISEVK